MRKLGGAIVAWALLAAGAAQAAENFIPMGLGYTPERERLPPLNSPLDELNAQTDIYESEINRIQRERAIQATELSRHLDLNLDTDTVLTPEY
ncbi:MAG TPA: hypothetical protein VH933_02145 [Aestuariivirgaceae bacterium]|jgi:hypothetical protein